MLYLVGVGHVFPLKGRIKDLVYRLKPDAVCAELDQLRYQLLIHKERGGATFPLNLLSNMYDRISDIQGAEVGEEMVGVIEAAKELTIPYFFIDVPVQKELPNALKSLPFVEKIKLYFSALAVSIIPKKTLKKASDNIMDNPDVLIDEFEHHYPYLKKMLLDNREKYMTERLKAVLNKFETVMSVVGEGHIRGISNRLSDYSLKIIHLKDILKKDTNELISEFEKHSEEKGIHLSFNIKENRWEGIY